MKDIKENPEISCVFIHEWKSFLIDSRNFQHNHNRINKIEVIHDGSRDFLIILKLRTSCMLFSFPKSMFFFFSSQHQGKQSEKLSITSISHQLTETKMQTSIEAPKEWEAI